MEWISVDKKLPRSKYEKVLFFGKMNNIYYGRHMNKNQFYSCDKDCTVFGVTHWMPLPLPPKP